MNYFCQLRPVRAGADRAFSENHYVSNLQYVKSRFGVLFTFKGEGSRLFLSSVGLAVRYMESARL